MPPSPSPSPFSTASPPRRDRPGPLRDRVLLGVATVLAAVIGLIAPTLTPAAADDAIPAGEDDAAVARPVEPDAPDQPEADARPTIAVAALQIRDEPARCFDDTFLADVARRTELPIDRAIHAVRLTDDELFDYPLLFLHGERRWQLTDNQRKRLADYLAAGGTLVVSTACSDRAFSRSFLAEFARVAPGESLEPVEQGDPLLASLYRIDTLRTIKPTSQAPLLSLRRDGRHVVLFTPIGLNGTDFAGKGCCCCGGNEIRNAKLLKANILAYALTP